MKLLILIPAAGSSSRMRGGDKLLEFIKGEAQLARIVKAALATGAQVLVTLGRDHIAREVVLNPTDRLDVITLEDADEGMAASLRNGAEQAEGQDGMMVLPADMPELETIDLLKVMDSFSCHRTRACRATGEDGTLGHPVILPSRLFPAVKALTGDAGARRVLQEEKVQLVPLPGQKAVTDLDTPEDWAAWRAKHGL